MDIHGITIFTRKSFTPHFNTLSAGLKDVILHLSSGTNERKAPEATVFFANIQEATNFKNAIIQSWETFLKKTKESHET